jgi:hypothetical protein
MNHALTFAAEQPPRAEARPPRQIWELPPETVRIVLGILLDHSDLQRLFLEVERDAHEGVREDSLLEKAVERCQCACRLAVLLDKLLSLQSERLRVTLAPGEPMISLAERWEEARRTAGGRYLAALLWRLAQDGRPELRSLVNRVRGDLTTRALRGLGGH